MARSAKCIDCVYSGRLRGLTDTNWRESVTCDHLILTGKVGDKGDDPNNCLLFQQRTKESLRTIKKLY